MGIISVSGKIGSGKDTVGKIIQILTDNPQLSNKGVEEWLDRELYKGKFEIRKWADSLKDIVCILIGCTREQLEDHEFKDTPLGEEWIRYSYADGFYKDYFYKNGEENMTTVMNAVPCTKERYEEELRVNWQTAYKVHYTPRLLLQHIGTELMRNQLLDNIWVNSLMSKYKSKKYSIGIDKVGHQTIIDRFPNWIITDTRFENELKAVKDRNGISIRVKSDYATTDLGRLLIGTTGGGIEHESETALDTATFDYEVDNNSTILDLIEKVRNILVKEKVI